MADTRRAAGSDLAPVPLRERWYWAGLLSRSHCEHGTPIGQWRHAARPGPVCLTALFWVNLLVWRPVGNGHAIINATRWPLGRIATVLVAALGLLLAELVLVWNVWLGAVPTLVAALVAFALVNHAVNAHPHPTSTTYISNFIRRSDSPPGSGRPVLAAAIAAADTDGRTLGLHTTPARLAETYQNLGFTTGAAPDRKGRIAMVRTPSVAAAPA